MKKLIPKKSIKLRIRMWWLDIRVWLVKKIIGPNIMIGWDIPIGVDNDFAIDATGYRGIVRENYFSIRTGAVKPMLH